MQLLIDLVRAVKGLSRLFRFDASYVGYFDKSIQGTWRSFFAMMLVAPILAEPASGLEQDLSQCIGVRIPRGAVSALCHQLVHYATFCRARDRPVLKR
jgi:hypothetical protein